MGVLLLLATLALTAASFGPDAPSCDAIEEGTDCGDATILPAGKNPTVYERESFLRRQECWHRLNAPKLYWLTRAVWMMSHAGTKELGRGVLRPLPAVQDHVSRLDLE